MSGKKPWKGSGKGDKPLGGNWAKLPPADTKAKDEGTGAGKATSEHGADSGRGKGEA
jgi:hypothetical protein